MARGRTTARRARAHGAPTPLIVYGANPVRELLQSGSAVNRVWLGPGADGDPLAVAAEARGIPVERVERAALDRVAGSPHHQGAVASAPPFRYVPLESLLAPECRLALVLDGVQDPRNLGAILRTARAFGVRGVVLPRDRSAAVTPVVVAAAAGLLFDLAICQVPNLVRAMGELKDAGYWLVGLVPKGGTALSGFDVPARPALVAGGEGLGMRHLVGRTCDYTVSIEMAPGVDSLNVGVAVAVALWHLAGSRHRA
jgi:23S rRNA (guanosine2251-2'-O)-methyltransferase